MKIFRIIKRTIIIAAILFAVLIIMRVLNGGLSGPWVFSMPSWKNFWENLAYSGPRAKEGRDLEAMDFISQFMKTASKKVKSLGTEKPSAYPALRAAARAVEDAKKETSWESEIVRQLKIQSELKAVQGSADATAMVNAGDQPGNSMGDSESLKPGTGVYGENGLIDGGQFGSDMSDSAALSRQIGNTIVLDEELTEEEEPPIDRTIVVKVDPYHTTGGVMRNQSYGRLVCSDGLVIYSTSQSLLTSDWIGWEIVDFGEGHEYFSEYLECYASDLTGQRFREVDEEKQILARGLLGLEVEEWSEELSEDQAKQLTEAVGLAYLAGRRYRFHY